MARHDVCASADVSVGALVPVTIGRARVVLTRLPSGELRAIGGRCPHMGARLEFGCVTGLATGAARDEIVSTREGEVLRCPWHGFEFDLVSGMPAVPPPACAPMRLHLYAVAEEGTRVLVTT